MSSFFIKFHQKFLSLKLQSQIINYCIFHVIVLNLEAENKIQEKHTPPPTPPPPPHPPKKEKINERSLMAIYYTLSVSRCYTSRFKGQWFC